MRNREEWEAEVQKKYNNVIDFLDEQQSGFKKAIKEGTMHGGGMKAGRRKKRSGLSEKHRFPYPTCSSVYEKMLRSVLQ